MLTKWFERQHQRHADMLIRLATKAKHSWVFSLVLLAYIGWEIFEHVLLPLAAAAFGIFWLWEH